ncbi:MAG: Ig-like domain-containing protein, partial [Bacillota bacterium]
MRSKRSGQLIAVVLAMCMILGSGPMAILAQAGSDIEGHWAEQVINRWVDRKIVDGYPDGTFQPSAPIKRAEFAALINRTFGFATLSAVEFSDVSGDQWFATDVSKAVGAGYMDGYPDGTFKPNANISRQEAAIVLARILGFEKTEKTFGFTDIETIPAWSLWAVVAVANAGIMTGYPDGSFGPTGNFTRAETVTVLDRLVAEVFTEEGTYGDVDEQTVIEGNVVVLAENVKLCNYHITGDLLIAESVGEGAVTLDRVIVDGELTVKGGGADSVVIKNSTVVTLIVDKEGVRIVIQDGTRVSEAYVRTPSRVEQDADGKGIEALTIEEIFGEGEVTLSGDFPKVSIRAESGRIVVDGGHIDRIIVESDAADVVVELGSNASVTNLVLDAPVTVEGTGKIEAATVNASGAVIEQQPGEVVLPEGVSANIGGKDVVGSAPVVTPGGSSTPSKVSVSAISITTVPAPDVDGKYANDATVTVTLDTTTSGATIYYTLDGTTPTSGSTKYTEPFTVEAPGDEGGPVIVKAIGMRSGYTNSAVATKTITFRTAAVPVDKEITSVASIADISVAYGTELSAVGLPTTVEVTLDDETTRNLSVTWDGGTPAYDGNTAGEYVFAGTLTLVEGLANTGGHKAQIKVIVAEAVPVDKEITSVASIADISVAYGTELSAVGLPTTVEVTLDDETTRNLSVTWDGGTPAYDGNTAGEYVFAGTLTLVEGLANTGGHKAQIKVIVAEAVPVDKEITSVASIADISVAYGTELSAVGLPTTVEVTLDDETTRNLSVTWDGGTPAYDGNTAGEYVFAGTLTLVEGLANTGGHKAQIKVIVAEAVPVDKEITSVASIADISVAYGTELSAVGLPTTVEVTLDDETTRNLSVTWDGGTPAYDGNTAGEYVFAGTLTLVEGLANTGGHKAQIKVIVAEAVPVDKEITSVASIADISVAYGTELSAVGLPTTVEVTLDDETTRNLSVTWDGGTPAYDGNTAGEYVFAGTLTLVEGLANTGGHKAQIKVIVAEAVPVDKEITSVASIADISVAYGTELSAVGLPTTVEVTLDDETTRNLSVTWDGGTPAYDGNTAGEYVFAGTLTLVEGLANTGGHKAQIKVIVAEAVPVDKEITSVASIADISVAYGTELSAVGLPTTVEVTLDDETTRNLSVTWDGGTPAYDGNTAGEYVFAGTLTLVEGLANTGGHKAQIKVIVAEAVPVDKEITSVASIADISVAYGTELSAVGLPTTVEVTLDDETTRNLSVTWDGGTPAYDGNTAGEYVFAGTLTLVEGLANTGGHKAQIKVIVAEAVPVDKEITSVASIADISVAYGTELSAVGLPTTVEVTLDDETTRNLSVTWDGGTPAYDGNTAGEYVFAGTLTLVEGLANTGGHKAQIKVIVAEAVPVDKEITSVASIADISVAYGTELSAVGLPTTVEVTLDDETTRNLSVTWDGGTPAYDGNTAGEYVFAGTLTLVEGLANTGGHKAQIKVIVAEAVPVDKEITSVASIADISVAYGTELSAVGLPTTVEVTLDDETTRNLSVTWDGGTPAYDGNTAGEYVFAGTLTLVEGLANTGGHKAQIKVIVAEAVPVDKEITSVASIADISVAYGTELSAVGLPTTVEVTLDDETTRNLSVTWDGGTPAYDGNTAGEYVFAGTLTLVEGLANTGGHKAQIKVIVAEAVPVDKEITSVASIADISVAYGTELSAVGLPTTVEVTLDDETTRNLSVTWDGGTPAYDGNTAGEYVFAGTLTLVEGLANTGGHKAQIKVIVAEAVPVDKEITSVASIADISVAYGTELSAVGLPTTVEVTLDDETTRNLSVTWDGGTPAYDGNTAGEYVFAGTLTLVEGLANTGGHKAQIKVIVAEAVPVDKEITSVASIADISVAYGTELSAVGLPTTVEVTLDDETTRNLSVTWDGGTPAYDGNTAGEYVFAGTLTLVEGLANTGGHKAQIKVIVAEAVPVDKEITSVASIADISVAYGTELSAVGLPTTVEVTLDDETTRNLSVTWDGGTPAYDGNTAGEYVFAGTLTLVEGLANTGGHKAQIKVIVAEAVPVDKEITSVASIADISVAYGTELSAVGLPTTVEVTLDDETTRNLSVTWDGGTPAYDGNTAGEYVFAGTLTLVEGLANTGGHKAQIKVIVAEAVPVDKEITSVASIADISVAYGTELSAVGLPTTVEVTLDDETTRNLSVTWDGGTPAYDGNTAGEYVFAGTLTLVEGLANTGGHKAQIKVIV